MMFSDISILAFIKDVYPVSFIAIILIFLGYIKGYIIFRLHTKSLEKRLEKTH